MPTPHGFIRGSDLSHPTHGFIRGNDRMPTPHGFIRGNDGMLIILNRFNGFHHFHINPIHNTGGPVMAHSLTKIWIHGVFATKDRAPLILREHEPTLHSHIKEKLEKELNCDVRAINGTADHVHILFQLNPNIAIKDVFKSIKGESSNWWNHSDFSRKKFSWQTGYGAFSVSESTVEKVENYIRRQKEHHKKLTFGEEFDRMAEKYGLVFGNR
jgi:putative transposase